MDKGEADKEAAIKAAEDRGEYVALMEPLLIGESSRQRPEIADLVVELASRAAGFRRSLPEGLTAAIAHLVRAMNCYYSNLIEGHDTHPVDIERALKDDYSADKRKRDLQLEARAHIAVQEWIDAGGLAGRATTAEGLREMHRRFCAELPEDLLWIQHPSSHEWLPVKPGELREHGAQVGRHVPVSPEALPRFLERFEGAYGRLGLTEGIIASACAHHRLLWIHPFLDGNGRVARLMSHAILLDWLDTGGIWSVARGLARNESEYKSRLMACDLERRNDFDGRGHLSEEALADFTKFFLRICIDQIDFMERLMQPDRLRERLLMWAEEEIRADTLPPKSGRVLEALLYRNHLPRGDIAGLVGVSERQARRITAALIDSGIVTSKSSRAPLYLAFPVRLAPRLMPGLFPEMPYEAGE
ncbi:Fic family protein [Halorhodospira sp. 9622]|uniref:Fic family protein n=1 Tax=Halorhodospira sp. 9622 TaxID=2899136 RepID=UPI001EE8DFE3|nr:Fic family protein [Halorhodospira sp. 9622]MCG5539218.1 Fic family protein [Halorhodospira sp. 9622]